MKVSLIQMNSTEDKARNLDDAERMIRDVVAAERSDLVVLPEYFAFLGEGRDVIHAHGEYLDDSPTAKRFSELAAELGITLHLGSMVEKSGNNHYNTTLVFDPNGREIARYRKMHLFDIDVPGGQSYRESDTISRGEDVVIYKVGDVTVGCAICYDIRFPELFRALRDKGAEVIVLPAAFTLMTGKDHWEILSRARAIETQTYFLAIGQFGTHANGKKACWGHSMVIDPWGHMIAQASDGVGTTSASLDMSRIAKVRQDVPVAQHHVI